MIALGSGQFEALLVNASAYGLYLGGAVIARRGFHQEAVKRANAALIETIEDSLRIAEDGRQKHAEAASELEKLETELRETLISARARVNAGNVTTAD